MNNIPLLLCGIFYAVLCIFSIVTGLIYMSGKKELNPLELSDRLVEKLKNNNKLKAFAQRMGFVTFVVGLVQGLTAYAIIMGRSVGFFALAMGFTVFSICSVLFKLKSKINAFPLMKLVFYIAIMIILLINRNLYF